MNKNDYKSSIKFSLFYLFIILLIINIKIEKLLLKLRKIPFNFP